MVLRDGVGIVLASCLIAAVSASCKHASPERPSTIQAVEVPFPWPQSLPEATPKCAQLEKDVRAGLALEEDVWATVTCVVDRLVVSQRVAEVEAYLEQVRSFETSTTLLVDVPRTAAVAAGLKVPPAAGEMVRIYATANQLRAHSSLSSLRTPIFNPGGYRGLCMPWRRRPGFPGHYEVTKQAISGLRNRGVAISSSAEALLADASQDPDIFEWKEMAAHGQTADANGLAGESIAHAEERWRTWIVAWLKEAGKRCSDVRTDRQVQGLYLIGYASHAIEDVASHRGRTNPEHAYNSLFEENPDKVEGIDALAAEMTASAAPWA